MLRLEREGGSDAQPQGAGAALAARKGQTLGRELRRELGAHQRFPLGDELRLAEAALAQRGAGDSRHFGGDRAQAAASVLRRSTPPGLVHGAMLASLKRSVE